MKDQIERQMIVGNGISIHGKIENCDRLVLDGNMNCELSGLKTLIVSESGSFTGQGHVEHAEISGKFEGDLTVSHHITILETGLVNGSITYKSIEIKPGGRFTGSIVLQEPDHEENAKSKEKDLLERAVKNRMSAPIG